MAAKETGEEGEHPLIFGSGSGRTWSGRMAFVLLVSFLMHVAAFYTFQVVYPPTERVTPLPMRVTLLHEGHPASVQLLRKLEDRAIATGSEVSADRPGLSLREPVVEFRPSFHDHSIELKRPEPMRRSTNLPSLLSSGETVLPPVEAVSPEPDIPNEAAPERRVELGPVLEERGARIDREKLDSLLGELPPGGRMRILAGVDSAGVVRHFLLDQAPAQELPEGMIGELARAFRFENAAGSEIQWDWIKLIW